MLQFNRLKGKFLKPICKIVPFSSFTYFIFLCVFSSCAGFGPAGPNKPYEGDYPPSYSQLTESNPLLARELAKLPEIQDGISSEEGIAIMELTKFYFTNKTAFDEMFLIMDEVGIPEVRQFCTPLQALFWMAEDDTLKEQADLLADYSLNKLLQASWDFSTKPDIESLSISESKAAEIVASIDKSVIWYAKNQKSAKDTLILCYTRSPQAIPEEHRRYIESIPEVKNARAIFIKNQARWSEPDIIIDRLNSPQLLDYYINKNIRYAFERPNYVDPAERTLRLKRGGCDEVAWVGKIALYKAGYDVEGRIVGTGSDTHVGLVVKNEDGTYLVAVNFRNSNAMSGPYNSLYEADQALGYLPSIGVREVFNFNRNWD